MHKTGMLCQRGLSSIKRQLRVSISPFSPAAALNTPPGAELISAMDGQDAQGERPPAEATVAPALDPLLVATIRAHFGPHLGAEIAENVAKCFPGWDTKLFKDWVA